MTKKEQSKPKSVVPIKYRAKYKAEGHAGTCGDDLANTIKSALESGVTLAELAKANDLTLERWAHLNRGMQRMNLGNVLRGRAKQGIKVVIPKTKVA